MLFSTMGQAEVFLSMVACGVMVGALYESIRLIRRAFGHAYALTAVMDLVFWAGAAVLIYFALLRVNQGILRVYTLLGTAVGWALYELGIAPLVALVLRFGAKLGARLKTLPLIRKILR